jgi:aminoglycoside phosphotransferase (APT) family kinase protein
MHPDQLTVPVEVVCDLVASQFPRWRDLAVTAFPSPGTENALFRIGDSLAARFPLQAADVTATRKDLEDEALAARELAGRTRFRQ